jgi:hypothetical protein
MTTPEQIVHLLREASHAYYNGGKLKMDDDAYDGLVERLKELDPENPYFEGVGAPPSHGAVKLPYPMPSLDKIKPGQDQLTRFLNTDHVYVLSEKLDGLSALWVPATKKLYLRGDGIQGQDVSHLVPLGIQGLKIPSDIHAAAAIRGELILPRSEGESLARSWVNGQVHQKIPSAAEIKRIHFVAYELLGNKPTIRSDQFTWLKTNGFEVPWYSVMSRPTVETLEHALIKLRVGSVYGVGSLYDTDGIVVGLNTVPKPESTATKAKNPKDCVAFKMPLADQSAETTVREVIWAPSAQGYLIPRLRFDPVLIGSATIEFCTGHNARTMLAGKLGPGAKVIIRRSGDVIPKLDKVLVPASTASFPPKETWAWDGAPETAAHIKLVGRSDSMVSAKLHYFLKTLEIPGAGPATATALVAEGITGPAALWGAPVETLAKVLGPKTGASLHTNIRTVLGSATELILMHASSTMPRGVGDTKLTSLFQAEADPRKWASIEPPTGWTKDSFQAFLQELPTYTAWRAKELHWIPYPILNVAAPPPLRPTGEVICMTGFRDKDIEAKAVARGHSFTPSFTSRVNILLVPDGPVKESEKVRAAKEKGAKILSRSTFITQYLT